jgi:hypothetical protein
MVRGIIMKKIYKVYTRINYADTTRDPNNYEYKTIVHTGDLQRAIDVANKFITVEFFKNKTKLEKGENNILFTAMDFCSYPKIIFIEEIEVI